MKIEDNLELRILKIEKIDKGYLLYVDLYKIGHCYDEYQTNGTLYLDNIEDFDPNKSIEIFVEGD